MTAISAAGTTTSTYATLPDDPDTQDPTGTPPPPPPGGKHPATKGENAGLHHSGKLHQMSQLLDMDSDDVTDQATTASGLVNLVQSKGVDLSSLRDVLDNGDLIDVSA